MGSFLDKKQIADRLKSLIGDMSVRQTAIEGDIDPSQFNKIVNAELNITPKILDKLVSKYNWDRNYILYGKNVPRETGDISKAPQGRFPKRTKPGELINFYDTDFAAGEIEFYDDSNVIAPAYTMDIPDFAGCTAFRTYGTSMEKLIKSGSILFGTKLEDWRIHLEYGQIYGIICTDKRKYLKYIRKDDDNLNFLLKSENKEMYDDMILPKSEIKSIWLIHGWINKRT